MTELENVMMKLKLITPKELKELLNKNIVSALIGLI